MSDELDFSGLETVEIPVTGPDKIEYILSEASEDDASAYRATIMKGASIGTDGKASSLGPEAAFARSLIVSRCLRRKDNNNAVSRSVVSKWKPKVVRALFEKIDEISELIEDKENPTDEPGGE